MQLLKYFHELSLHPANAKQLKALILQLAVQGKLTAQWRKENPDVEPAAKLLERVKAEKERLIKEKKIKKEEYLLPITEDEVPFELPENWEWCRLGDYTYNHGQKKPDKMFTYIDVSSIDNVNGIIIKDLAQLSPVEAPSRARKIVKRDSLIYSTVRPYLLNIAIIDRDFENEPIVSTAFAVLNTLAGTETKYLFHVLRSDTFTLFVEKQMIGLAYPAINDGKLMQGIITIPPLEEQKAIVETVDRLFKEVEQLEQLTESRIRIKEQFALSALRRLAENNTPQEWEALQPHFHSFFNHTPNIKKLRETILQLAVQGKLTARWRKENSPFEGGSGHPDDHNAALLLQKIKAEKACLIAQGKIKKENPLPEISAEEIPYELPEGWVWCNSENLFRYEQGIQVDKNLQLTNEMDGFVRFLRIVDFTQKTDDIRYVKSPGDKHFISVDTLVMVRYGASAGFIGSDLEGVLANNLFKIHYGVLIKAFVKLLFQSPYFMSELYLNTKGGAMPAINFGFLNKFKFPLAPLMEQQAIVETVSRLMALCDRLEQEVASGTSRTELWMKGAVREVMNF